MTLPSESPALPSTLQPISYPMYQTLPSLADAHHWAQRQLPLHSPNALTTVLMTYHNTLIQHYGPVGTVSGDSA